MVEELYALKKPNTYPSKSFIILLFLFTFFSTFYLNNEVSAQNLTISKFGSISADPGDIISYTIHYTNTGITEATEVEITDYLPDLTSYTYVSSFPAGIYDAVSNTLSWTQNEIPALASLGAESGEITIQLRAGNQAANTYYYISSSPITAENYASIKSLEESAEVNSQTVSTEIDQYCALTFSPLGEGEVKSNGNSTVRYLVNVINQGNIYDQFTIDTLQFGHPQEDILLDISLYDLSGNPLTVTDWLAPGDAFYFYVDVFLDDPAAANNFNYVDLIGTSTTCPSTTESTTLETKIHNPAPNKALLLLSKLDNTDPIRAGDTLSYTIYIYNYSGFDTQDLIVTETYDPNVTFLSATPSPTTGDNIWELPPLVGGDFTTIEVNVIVDMDVPNGTYLTNYVLADATNADDADDTSTTTLVESYPDLDIQKTGLPNPAFPNDIVTYTITYANLGNLTAENVEITDDYDENYLSITNPNGATDNGSTLVFSLPDLAPGASGSLSYEAQINSKASFLGGTTLVNNTAQILTSTTEINFNNNEVTEIISVTLLPDLTITLTASSEPTPVNQDITYTITITNLGNYRSENVLIENILPAGLTFVSASDGGTFNAGTITWPIIPTMHVVDILTRTFIATPDCSAVPSVTNTATVSNDILETDYTNNSVSLLSTIESDFLLIDCPLDQNVAMDAGVCGAIISFTDPTAEDDCEGAIPVVRTDGSGLSSGDIFPEGITTISYSATNSSGQTVNCSFDISVGPDTELPVIHNVPSDVTLECSDCIQAFENNDFEEPVIGGSWASIDASAISGWSTTAVDNRIEIQKSGMIEGVVSYSGNQHAELNGNNVGDFYQEFCTVPTTTVQISFAHHKRMSASNTSDDIMEVLTGPDMGNLSSLGLFTATATSGWSIHTIDFPIPAGQSSTVFVFRAIQGAPSNTTLGNLIDDINVITLFDATNVPYATDNCGVESLSLSEVKTDGSCANDYRIDRTWTAVDLAGNTSTATQTVIVGDVIGPDFTLPADITISCTENPLDTTLTGNISNLTDNCDPNADEISYSDATTLGSCPSNYTITRTWTLTDHCSNSTSKTQIITIQDIIAPQFVEALPTDQTVDCSTIVATETLTATDNCGSAAVSYTEIINPGACTGIYTSVRTWTAEDECGNTTTHTQTIQFEDNTAPTWTNIAGNLDRTVECSSPTDFDDAMALVPAATDDCGTITVTLQSANTSACIGGYTVTRKWIATDDCGNASAEYIQVITVDDTTAPDITTTASDATIECDGSGNTTELNNWLNTYAGAEATDNCSTITWSDDFGALSDLCGETGAVTVTFTATDNCGNFASTTATFTIEDTTAPDITTTASDATVECDGAGNVTELNNWLNANGGASAADVCGTTIIWTNDYTNISDDCGETGNTLVTFTATDECGNTNTTSATFTIEDTTPPNITTIASDATVECDGAGNSTELNNWLDNFGGASAADVCGTTIIWTNDYTNLSDECGETGNALITFTATDECGNTNTTSATFTIEDTTVPIWTTLDDDLDRTVECSSPTDFDDAMALIPIATDDCGTITIDEQPEVVGVCVGGYTVTRKWLATDDCGNVSATQFTQIITVDDTTPPVITTSASDATVECDGAGNTTELNNWLDNFGGAEASDNCSTITWDNDYGSLSDLCGETGAVTVTFTATDNCGNFASTTATFTIEDTTAPDITTTASDATVECDGAGNVAERDNWLNTFGGAAASDVCGTTISWSNDFSALSDDCGETGNALVTFTATDECGNTATTSATFNVEDTTAPNITTVAINTTVECDGAGNIAEYNTWLSANAGAVASDICGATISWSNAIDSETATCGDAKEILVDFTAADECGNTAITSATFIIEDNTAPVWTTVDGDLDRTVECSDPTDFDNAVALTPVATDDCGNITVSLESEDISVCIGSYTVTRKWIATDDCGNASVEYIQVITVDDTTPPDITTAASDATVECDGSGNTIELNNWLDNFGGAEASDNCSTITWDNDYGSLSDLCGETGAVTVTFTATDNCGNFASTTATFTIEDTTVPDITTTASDATVECDGAGNSIERDNWLNANGGADASDVCGTTIVWSNDFSALSDDCGETGSALVTFTATDECGNTNTTSATFTIEDTTAPNITTVAINTTVECDGSGNIAEYNTWLSANAGAVASDICGATISWSNAINSETATCGDAKEILVDFMATDECGNTAITSATFIIEDNTAPDWSTLAGDLDRTVECSSPTDFDNAMALIPIATDDCSTITIDEQPEVVSLCVGSYTVTRKWIATDDCGNSSLEYTQVITVDDTTPPDIDTIASDLTVECDGSGNIADLNNWLDTFGGAEATDNCSIVDWTNDFGSLSDLCAETGDVTVTFTATDNCGNFASTTAIFTIEDTSAPEITTTASDATVECDGAGNSIERDNWLNANGGADASDVCGTTISWSNDFSALSDDCGETGNALVTFTATDECGNTAITSASFTIEDTTAPDITTVASNTIVECDGARNSTERDNWLNANGGAAASDICGASIVWTNDYTSLSDDCGETGNALVTFTATDECGNTSTTSATFTIEDTTSPDITTAASDATVECDGSGNTTELNDWLNANGGATASDVCGTTISWSNDYANLSDECAETGSVNVTFTAADECGNTSTTSATFTIEDTTLPEITTTASDATAECDGAGNTTELNDWLNANGGAIASDNCDNSLVWTNDYASLSDECAETGTVNVTFTVTDACGNYTSTSASFTITDSTAPSFSVEASNLNVECDGSGNTTDLNDWLNANGGAIASDVCGTTVTWTNDFTALSDECGETGNTLVSFSVTDECGNTAITSATFTIEDTTAPSWETEALSLDRNLDCTDTEGFNAASTLSPTASDLCGTYTISLILDEITESSCPSSYTTQKTWGLIDECGNAAENFVQTIIVSDNTPPVTEDLTDVHLSCEDSEGLASALLLRPSFSDDCSPQMLIQVELISDETTQECLNTYVRTRQWQGSDLCGNSSISQQKIYVEDITPPTADPLPSLFFLCKNDIPDPDPEIIQNADDNCSSTILREFSSDISNNQTCPETITRNYRITDDCGNESYLIQVIIVHDTIPPTADQPETLTFVQISDVPDPNIEVILNTWDNCTENPYVSIVSTSFDDISSPPYFIYEYKVEDECRNQTRIMHQLIVNDFPLAEDDAYTIDENSKNNIFRILENDFFGFDGPGNPSLFINSSPFYGELSINDNGTPNNFLDDFFVYSPNRNTYEDDSFEYSIADEDGEEANALVSVSITPNPLHIPEAFSPNGDGINEFFHIRGLYYYPKNSIIIYDEKGDKVFESDPYDNDWNGTNHFSINPFEVLPQATYFYILDLGDGRKPIKGYVYINRLN